MPNAFCMPPPWHSLIFTSAAWDQKPAPSCVFSPISVWPCCITGLYVFYVEQRARCMRTYHRVTSRRTFYVFIICLASGHTTLFLVRSDIFISFFDNWKQQENHKPPIFAPRVEKLFSWGKRSARRHSSTLIHVNFDLNIGRLEQESEIVCKRN